MPSSRPDDRTGTVHATCVALDGRGVLLFGPSGVGKSDLALRLLDRGWRLVADDRTALARTGDGIDGHCPAALAGRLEVRGVGLVTPAPTQLAAHARIALCITLCAEPGRIERLPETESRLLLGRSLPMLRLYAFEASAARKLELILQSLNLADEGS